jgi:hypothetical protein
MIDVIFTADFCTMLTVHDENTTRKPARDTNLPLALKRRRFIFMLWLYTMPAKEKRNGLVRITPKRLHRMCHVEATLKSSRDHRVSIMHQL